MAFRAVLDKMTVAATSAGSVYSSNIFSCYLVAAKIGPSVGRGPQDIAILREWYAAISLPRRTICTMMRSVRRRAAAIWALTSRKS